MKILSDLTLQEMEQLAVEYGEAKYRGGQLYSWIQKGSDFSQMCNLPKTFTEKLQQQYCETGVKIHETLVCKDSSVKFLYALSDSNLIEGILMTHKYGKTLCVSTQVGCRMGCAFCASGIDGLVRNLTAGEILGQVILANRYAGEGERAITNIVLMGSGEPLDNYENVTKFLRLVCCKEGLNFSQRNISLSTCGLSDKIKELADDGFSVTLTISLHQADDEKRKTIMPIAKKYSISSLMEAARYYFEKTKRRIIFEYSLIQGKNDGIGDARELARLTKRMVCHVNLIKLNYVKEKALRPASNESVQAFMKELEKANVSVTLRRSMGNGVDGACGQLRRRYLGKSE